MISNYSNKFVGSKKRGLDSTSTAFTNLLNIQCANPIVNSSYARVATAGTNMSSSLQYLNNAYGVEGVSYSGGYRLVLCACSGS